MPRTKETFPIAIGAPMIVDLRDEHVHKVWVLTFRPTSYVTVVRLPDGSLTYAMYVGRLLIFERSYTRSILTPT